MKKSDSVQEIKVKNAMGEADTVACIVVQNKIEYTPKVSIVLPCYNVENYINQCLDSLVSQTLEDIEIICVDDKSTDGTLELVRKRMKQDKRIKVIAQPNNKGVSVARNMGIEMAQGEYVGFVDPDDYVDLDYYEKLYNKIVETQADVCASNIKEHDFNGSIKVRDDFVARISKDKKYFNYTMWCAIYRNSFLKENKIYCPEGVTNGEDTVFCLKCAMLANKVEIVPDAYYHYVRYEGSAETQYYKEKHINSRIKMAEAIISFVNSTELSEDSYAYCFDTTFWYICYNVFQKTTSKELRKKSLKCAIDLYRLCKYKKRIGYHTLIPFLESEDVDGMYDAITGRFNKAKITRISLFKKITLVKCVCAPSRTKVYILGLPVFYVFYSYK